MPDLYADVIVDISSGQVDRVFAYRVPPAISGRVEIGSQVRVPFGRGDRNLTGYVVGLSDTTDFDPSRIKNILDIVNEELAIESQLIRLAWQMKQVYGCTMNQALKTVIPVRRQVRSVVDIRYRLSDDRERVMAFLEENRKNQRNKARVRLLEQLLKDGVLTKRMITGELKIAQSTIESLKTQGIIQETSEEKYRQPVKKLMAAQSPVTLNAQQQSVADAIWPAGAPPLSEPGQRPKVHLIHGITGSGKTEVYMELIARALSQGFQAIVLIPEIALSLQTVSRFHGRFGDRVSVMNSRLSEGEKYDQYLRAKRGDIDIVVGPRSALFMPFQRLGLIVIDEEHDGAYKSENVPKFHARDVAAWRAALCGAMLVLGSATPSLESYTRALGKMYGLHELSCRAKAGSSLPQVIVADMREEFKLKNKKIFSRVLHQLIEEKLARREQIILFLNRRGYAGFVSCRSCGHVFKCRHCDVSMTAHNNGWLKCHYCGYEEPTPKLCPQCRSPYVAAFGTGTQKVEQMVAQEFPMARVLRLDRDSTVKKDSLETILTSFRNHEADILVGTQMIVKGHDFPDVTLVGILAADLSMFSNDYMASERTFQLLTQAAGRAGRAKNPGQVVIQTYNPEHYSIVCAGSQDYKAFYQQEILYRRMMNYPPAVHMMAVLIQSSDEAGADGCIEALAEESRLWAQQHGLCGQVYTPGQMEFVGPGAATVARSRDIYRRVLYVKHKKFSYITQIRQFMENFIKNSSWNRHVNVQFDIDPMSMY